MFGRATFLALLVAGMAHPVAAYKIAVSEAPPQTPSMQQINKAWLDIAGGFYPQGVKLVKIGSVFTDWLYSDLRAATVEQSYCIEAEEVEPLVWEIRGINRAETLRADALTNVSVPCPPGTEGRAHLHLKNPEEWTTCWQSLPDAISFKNRVGLYGDNYAFELIVCWRDDNPEVVAFSWNDIRAREAQSMARLPLYPPEFARLAFKRHFDLDIDALYPQKRAS